MRILIAGGPKTGKTTLAKKIAKMHGITIWHGDSLMPIDWSEASQTISQWMEWPDPWVIEGVQIFRALRKWIARHPEGRPCDQLIIRVKPFVQLSKGQIAMAKGCDTVFKEIESELLKRGIAPRYR